jgi:hypothetical protein
VQADTEHQEHHADLGELSGDLRVRDKARCGRTYGDAGEQITNQGW